MFSSRQLMMQGLRVNESNSDFHVAYLQFELRYFDKVMMRREVLNSGSKAIDFVNEDVQMQMPDGETQRGDEANFVKIVWQNLLAKFSSDILVLKKAKACLKQSKYLRQSAPEVIDSASEAVRQLKRKESAQLELINQIRDVNDISFEKIQKMANRAVNNARQALSKKLEKREDCLAIRLLLCEDDMQRLQILYACKQPAVEFLEQIEDKSSLHYLVVCNKGQSISKKVLQQLENAKKTNDDDFSNKCFVQAKSMIVSEMVRQNTALAMKYINKLMLTLATQPLMQQALIKKLSKSLDIQNMLLVLR